MDTFTKAGIKITDKCLKRPFKTFIKKIYIHCINLREQNDRSM